MVDKYNITIQYKGTKKIKYWLNLDNGRWEKEEYNHKDKITYFENSFGNWIKAHYDSKDNMMYCEDGNVKHNNR
jgi:hypothetical protein